MKLSCVIGIAAAAAMLSGCGGGSQSQLAPPGPIQENASQSPLSLVSDAFAATYMTGAVRTGVAALHPDRGPSWMDLRPNS
jgi:hypothetical protein